MCRLAVEMEGSLSGEVVGSSWHAEQFFMKIKFGNQGTNPAKGKEEPPEPCGPLWLLSLQGVCFCRTEGRVGNMS